MSDAEDGKERSEKPSAKPRLGGGTLVVLAFAALAAAKLSEEIEKIRGLPYADSVEAAGLDPKSCRDLAEVLMGTGRAPFWLWTDETGPWQRNSLESGTLPRPAAGKPVPRAIEGPGAADLDALCPPGRTRSGLHLVPREPPKTIPAQSAQAPP